MRTLILGLLLSACGAQQDGHDDDRAAVTRPIITPAPPAGYAFDDSVCQTDATTAVPITKSTIYAWEGSQVSERQAQFHDTKSETSLMSQAVAQTIAGTVYERSCLASDRPLHRCTDEAGHEKPWPATNPGRLLKICRDDFKYDRQSVEGIALTSLYFIQQARDLYLRVVAREKAAPPAAIGLSILPAFVSEYPRVTKDGKEVTERQYSTDNLAYFPGAQMIAVFPVLAEEKTAWAGFYWESSFVLGHEYGHHIDFTRHGRVLTSVGLQWNPLTHSFDDLAAMALGEGASSDRAQIAGAEAEGFADLLGYYLSGADGRSIAALERIGKDRDVGNAVFASGLAKTLTDERLATLFGRGSEGGPRSPFRDIHTTGAIIAYTINQMLMQVTAATTTLSAGSREELAERYFLALRYMDALVKQTTELASTDSGSATLQPIAAAIELMAGEALAKRAIVAGQPSAYSVTTAICRLARERLPAMSPAPFAHGGDCG